jgi:serine/threonine protein kinase
MEPLTADDPRQVSVFRLQARLGAGGMGRVYLGSSPGGRAVAVKVVHPELARDPEFMRRFRREVEAAEAVSGAYTAPVVGAGPDDSPPWLATAYVPGPSLAELVSGAGPLPEAAVWRLAGGLVEALQAIHARGLVHRDLKPANILIAADGPRVIDFGISRALHGVTITGTRTTMGTPAYMSPEQAEGREIGPASDVFSLGSVLAYAATGAAPFEGGEMFAVIFRIAHSDPDLGRLAPALGRLVAGCLAKDPAHRPSLDALLGAVAAGSAAFAGSAPGQFWPDSVAAATAARPASLPVTPPAPPVTPAAAPAHPTAPAWTPQPGPAP